MTKLICLASLLFAACGTSDSGSTTIDDGPLAGMVAGQPWTFTAGGTDAFLSDGDDNYFAELYAGAFTCNSSTPTGASLIVAVPKVPGDYPMSLQRNMTFSNGSDNKIAIDGRVVVESVTATTVTGGLVGTYDDQNQVSGHFTLTICADTH
jgi:hypothetical protein